MAPCSGFLFRFAFLRRFLWFRVLTTRYLVRRSTQLSTTERGSLKPKHAWQLRHRITSTAFRDRESLGCWRAYREDFGFRKLDDENNTTIR